MMRPQNEGMDVLKDKKGNKRYITEVVGRELTMLGTKDNTIKVAETIGAESEQSDNLPF